MSFYQSLFSELEKIAGMPKGMANVKTPYAGIKFLSNLSGRTASRSLAISKKHFESGDMKKAKPPAASALRDTELGQSLGKDRKAELKKMTKHDQFNARISSKLPNWAAPRLN